MTYLNKPISNWEHALLTLKLLCHGNKNVGLNC